MRLSNRTLGILLVLPSVLLMTCIVFPSILYGVAISFTDLKGFEREGSFVGLHNYYLALRDPYFAEATLRTLFWTGATLILQVALGLISALVLNEKFKGRFLFRGLVLFPYIVSSIVIAFIWKWMYDHTFGIINYGLMSLGIISEPVAWLSEPYAMFSLILTAVWQFYPFATLFTLARLQTISEDLYDAAKVDGANAWQRFVHITVPEIRIVVILIILLRFIFMFSKFDLIWIMTKGGPGTVTQTLPILIYIRAFRQMHYAEGCAMATLTFLILLVVAWIYLKFLKV